MKHLLAIVLVVSLAACAATKEPDTKGRIIAGLTALQSTVNLTIESSDAALQAGKLGWREACRIDQYTRLAAGIIQEAFKAVNEDKLDTAQELLWSAQDAATGIGDQVEALVSQQCNNTGVTSALPYLYGAGEGSDDFSAHWLLLKEAWGVYYPPGEWPIPSIKP